MYMGPPITLSPPDEKGDRSAGVTVAPIRSGGAGYGVPSKPSVAIGVMVLDSRIG